MPVLLSSSPLYTLFAAERGSAFSIACFLSITPPANVDNDAELQELLRKRGEVPQHVAAIMDGNGRWAQQRNQVRYAGHYEGVESVRDIVEACSQLGIQYLTLYTFSTENWERPAVEVKAIMRLMAHAVRKERPNLMANDVRMKTIGDLSQLPTRCQREIQKTVRKTASNSGLTLVLALSYSGRWDMTEAARQLATMVAEGVLDPEDVDEEIVSGLLDTGSIPDPDLLIRTGGEYRLSNFMLWQSAYSELYITDCYWPDFRREQLYEAIRSYQDRDRRFGQVPVNGHKTYASDT